MTEPDRGALPPDQPGPDEAPPQPLLRVVPSPSKLDELDQHLLDCYRRSQTQEGFRVLSERFYSIVLSVITRRLRPYRSWSPLWEMREDLANDTLLRLDRRLSQEGGPAAIHSNLRAVVQDTACSVVQTALRSKAREHRRFIPLPGSEDEGRKGTDGGSGVASVVESAVEAEALDLAADSPLMQAVGECKEGLQPRARTILDRWALGHPLQAIADDLNIAYQSVNVARLRATEVVAKCLKIKGFMPVGASNGGGRS